MDKSSIAKLRNYFSDRIEEIKDGSYVPTYEQIKDLPEFSGITRSTFRIARRWWYKQHFRMPFVKFTTRLEKIKARDISESKYDQEQRNKFYARLENIKGEYISEKEYDKEQIKGSRKIGFCISFIGALFIVYALVMGAGTGWNPNYMGGYFYYVFLSGVPGIILLSIGIFLILKNRNKASKI